jgi:hypothetical protein
MKIDYFHIGLSPDAALSMPQIIELVSNMPEDEIRNENFNNVPIRLQESHKYGRLWIGDMVRIRMTGIPPKTKLNGEQDDLDLDDDEGLGEATAFLFDPDLSILVLQRNHYAVSPGGFAHYFAKKGTVMYIDLKPVLRLDAMARLATMRLHRRLEISVAGLQNVGPLRQLRDAGVGVSSLIDISRELNGPKVSILVSMGHEQGSLERVMDFVRDARATFSNEARRGAHITKIVISGKEGEDEPLEIIDLIEDRMIDLMPVSVSRDHEKSRNERQKALRVAYRNRIDELTQMFRPLGNNA